MADDLPEGFTVDPPPAALAAPPDGFVVDQPASTAGSFWEGIKSGLTAGWNPQISGALASSGLESEMPYLTDEQLAAVQKAGGVQGAYQAARDQAAAEGSAAQGAHPYAYGAGDVAGAIAPMVLAPEAEGAGLVARGSQAAKIGAGYGALSGASQGEGPGGVLAGAGEGAIGGALGGVGGTLLGAGVGKLAGAAYDALGRPLAATVRGLINPEQEAARRVAGAAVTDYPQVAAGKTPGLTPAQFGAAKAAGEPVIVGDMGGETMRALMRSAANTSPEARAEIQNVIMSRFQDQNDRAGATIRSLVSGGANTTKTAAQLEAEYDAERGAAYGAAYQAGDRPIWSPELERLTNAPSVAGALRGAINNWKDWQVLDGFGGMNPPVKVTPDGQLQFTGGQGMLPYPNLQLWDYTARNLAGAASAAVRAGNNTEAARLGGLEKAVKSQLDTLVPEFSDARGVAATYFGGNNAIEAGQNALNYKGDPSDLKLALAKMKPAEAGMFQEAYADALARKAESMGDNRDVTLGLFNSPQDRAKIAAVFGQPGVDKLQAFVTRERIYDASRKALGNSTTVRQMIESGLAGGAAGGYLSNWDPKYMALGATGGLGASKLAGQAISSGVRTAVGYVDRNTAKKVAEYITSSDPSRLQQALQMAVKNRRIMQGLGDISDRMSAVSGASQTAKLIPQLPQLPSVAGAQPNQQQVPGPPSQQNNGGRINQQRPFAKGGAVKDTKSKVHYRLGSKNTKCELCTMFRKPNSCVAVSGFIAKGALCDLFERKQ
jgi:hypothetical protein